MGDHGRRRPGATFLVLALLACGDSAPGDTDGGIPRPGDGGPVQWVEDGTYEITWKRESGASTEMAGFERCTYLELRDQAVTLALLDESDPCGEPLAGTRRDPCSCFPGPAALEEAARPFCLCPNIASIYGELTWDGPDGPVVTSLRARPVP